MINVPSLLSRVAVTLGLGEIILRCANHEFVAPAKHGLFGELLATGPRAPLVTDSRRESDSAIPMTFVVWEEVTKLASRCADHRSGPTLPDRDSLPRCSRLSGLSVSTASCQHGFFGRTLFSSGLRRGPRQTRGRVIWPVRVAGQMYSRTGGQSREAEDRMS